MNNSKKLLKALESNTQTYNTIKQSVALAFERTNLPAFNTDSLCKDVATEFNYLSVEHITKAIRMGALGCYGKTYRISTQEICFWIRSYEKQNKQSIFESKLKISTLK